jgi:hypothetical protein
MAAMRIWDDFVSDSRGVLSWNVGRQGAGLVVFEVSSSTFSSCFKVPYQRKGISELREKIAEEHRDVLERDWACRPRRRSGETSQQGGHG